MSTEKTLDLVIKDKWIAALKSGNYQQITNKLKRIFSNNKQGHCCLGVLCEIEGLEQQIEDDNFVCFIDNAGFSSFSHLPERFREKVGLTQDQVLDLATMNDRGKTFEEIANHIRDEL